MLWYIKDNEKIIKCSMCDSKESFPEAMTNLTIVEELGNQGWSWNRKDESILCGECVS